MTLAPLTSLGLVHRNQSTRCDQPTSLCNQAEQVGTQGARTCGVEGPLLRLCLAVAGVSLETPSNLASPCTLTLLLLRFPSPVADSIAARSPRPSCPTKTAWSRRRDRQRRSVSTKALRKHRASVGSGGAERPISSALPSADKSPDLLED